MLSKLARHAGVIFAHSIGISIAFTAGLWLAQGRLSSEVASLIGAFAGAAIAVVGSFAFAEHRDRKEGEKLRSILAEAVQALLTRANWHSSTAKSPQAARRAARDVISHWQQVAAFSPYRELNKFSMISAMNKVDVACRALAPFAKDEEGESVTPAFGAVSAFLDGTQQVKGEVARACEQVAVYAQAALKELLGHAGAPSGASRNSGATTLESSDDGV